MKFFCVNGVRLAYRLDGPDDAPAIVMVNSLGTDMHMWDAQIALLSRTLRIVRYDCRGHGASDVPSEPYSIERFGLDLLALLDTLGIERAHLCGLSLGGMVALWFAARYPERVAHAVFANTAARSGTEEGWNARIDAVRKSGMSGIRDAVLARFLSEEFRRNDPRAAQQIGEMVESTKLEGYIGACTALRDADLHEMLSSISAPSLILSGELDEATPLSQSRELHAAIAGSELAILHEATHLSNVEQPEAFSQHLLAFLVSA